MGEFYKGGVYQYETTFIGAGPNTATGIKRGAYSISLNQRVPTRTATEKMANIGLVTMGSSPSMQLVRDTLSVCNDYECALNKLANDTIAAPCYYILAGVKDYEGAIISRDRYGSANITYLSASNWYLVQTNEDHFAGLCYPRCLAAKSNFDILTQENVSQASVFT